MSVSTPDDKCLWNKTNLKSPSYMTLEYTKYEYESLFAKTNFHLLFNDKLTSMCSLFERSKSAFADEKYILERLIYKNWNALRKEQSLKNMRKLKSLLSKLNSLSLEKLSETVMLLNKKKSNQQVTCLPSRELYEFYLFRLYAAYNLIEYCQNLVRSKLTTHFVRQIKNAVFLSNNLLYMSNISRIYCLISKYQVSISYVYNCLREYIKLFKSSGIEWSVDISLENLPIYLSDSKASQNVGSIVIGNYKNLIEHQQKCDLDEEMEEDIGQPIERSNN